MVAVVACGLLGLSVLAAAFSGPWELETRLDLGFQLFPPVTPTPPIDEPGNNQPLPEDSEPLDLSWLGGLFLIAFGLVIAAGALWLLNRVRFTRRYRVAMVGVEWTSDLAEPGPDLPALREGVDLALLRLADTADPEDAVIAAWMSIEEAASRSGTPRRAAQTPTEFTLAVLDATPTDPAAARGLLSLYHRARFSSHRTSHSDVAAATAYLVRMADGWPELADARQVSRKGY